jgi:hypothetical protein
MTDQPLEDREDADSEPIDEPADEDQSDDERDE